LKCLKGQARVFGRYGGNPRFAVPPYSEHSQKEKEVVSFKAADNRFLKEAFVRKELIDARKSGYINVCSRLKGCWPEICSYSAKDDPSKEVFRVECQYLFQHLVPFHRDNKSMPDL